jgi:hypothetical protein
MTFANCRLNESCTSSQSRSSVVSHRCLMTCPHSQALTPLTHSLIRGPWMYVRNNIALWYAFLMRLLVMFTPLYSCHCVMNSSALSRSPLKISGVLPTSLSPRPPGTTGAGGRGTGAGGPPPGVLHHLGILLLHRLETPLVVLPREAVPIRRGFLAAHFSFLVCLADLLGPVRLPGIELHYCHQRVL